MATQDQKTQRDSPIFKLQEILALIPPNAKQVLMSGEIPVNLITTLKNQQKCKVDKIVDHLQPENQPTEAVDYTYTTILSPITLPPNIGKYDCIIQINNLQQIINPWHTLKQLASHLTQKGTIIASIPNIGHPKTIKGISQGIFPLDIQGTYSNKDIRFFTWSEVFKLFAYAGLKITHISYHPARDNPRRFLISAQKPQPQIHNPQITIIVLAHNNLRYTQQTINSIRKHTATPHQIIVVDNASTDMTIPWLREQQDIITIENMADLSFSQANNQAIQCTHTPYICLINNDVIITPGWTEQLIWHLNQDPEALLVGPMTNKVSGHQKTEDINFSSIDNLNNYATDKYNRYKHKNLCADRVVFFCTMFKLEAFERVGLLDEDFLLGNYEDDDFCLRVIQSGHKNLIAQDTFVYHHGSITLMQQVDDYKESLEQNRKLFYTKHREYLDTQTTNNTPKQKLNINQTQQRR